MRRQIINGDDYMYDLDEKKKKVAMIENNLSIADKEELNKLTSNLYGFLLKPEIIKKAYYICRKKKGCAGIDGLTFKAIESRGIDNFINEIIIELKDFSYKPTKSLIFKKIKNDGTFREIKIPIIKDRVIQRACLILLEPIFEREFLNCSYGFRPTLGPLHALEKVIKCIGVGKVEIFDADLKNCFGLIPHHLILNPIKEKVLDTKFINLITKFLYDGEFDTNIAIENSVGVCQGSVISPLFSNIALHHLDKIIYQKGGIAERYQAHFIRYADDFIILAPIMTINLEKEILEVVLSLGLTINTKKTSIVRLRQGEKLSFLGCNFKVEKVKPITLKISPNTRNVENLKTNISNIINSYDSAEPLATLVYALNNNLTSWNSFYRLCTNRKVFRNINNFVLNELRKAKINTKDLNNLWELVNTFDDDNIIDCF